MRRSACLCYILLQELVHQGQTLLDLHRRAVVQLHGHFRSQRCHVGDSEACARSKGYFSGVRTSLSRIHSPIWPEPSTPRVRIPCAIAAMSQNVREEEKEVDEKKEA